MSFDAWAPVQLLRCVKPPSSPHPSPMFQAVKDGIASEVRSHVFGSSIVSGHCPRKHTRRKKKQQATVTPPSREPFVPNPGHKLQSQDAANCLIKLHTSIDCNCVTQCCFTLVDLECFPTSWHRVYPPPPLGSELHALAVQ